MIKQTEKPIYKYILSVGFKKVDLFFYKPLTKKCMRDKMQNDISYNKGINLDRFERIIDYV